MIASKVAKVVERVALRKGWDRQTIKHSKGRAIND